MRDELDILLEELEESIKESEENLKNYDYTKTDDVNNQEIGEPINFSSIIKDLEERQSRFQNEFINPARERLDNMQKEIDNFGKN